MINYDQLARYIIQPAIDAVGLYSLSAEQLLIGTAAAESMMGTYVHQMNGPALGIFQMEPATHEDIWKNFLLYRRDLRDTITPMVAPFDWQKGSPNHALLVTDLRYATIMARIHYFRSPKALPRAHDWPEMAKMWKSTYNTELGAGTTEHFMEAIYRCGVEGAPRTWTA